MLHSYIANRCVSNTIFCKRLVRIVIATTFEEAFCLGQVPLVEFGSCSNSYAARFQKFICSILFGSCLLLGEFYICKLAGHSQSLRKCDLVVLLQEV